MEWLIGAAIALVLLMIGIAIGRLSRRSPSRPDPVATTPPPAPTSRAPTFPAPHSPAPPEPLPPPAVATDEPPVIAAAPAAQPEPQPEPEPEPEPITIGDVGMSPLQYRYLFPDLQSSLPETERHIRHHYRHHGRNEIGIGQRVVPRHRLLAIGLQQLSPLEPQRPPSPNWLLLPPQSDGADTLNIFFSHGAPEGAFEPAPGGTETPGWRLFIKGENHGFFQRGIPGLTATIDETARWIEAVVARVRPRRIRTFGFSAGAYGAIVFGHLLSADAIYAAAPELMLGLPQYRSWQWYKARQYDPAYRDLRPFLPGLRRRLTLVYPAYEPIEYRMVQAARAAGLDNIAMGVDFHPGGLAVPLNRVLHSEETLVPAAQLAHPRHFGEFDDATVEDIAQAYEALAEREPARSEPLLERALAQDPENFGFMCHLGVHRGLLGDPVGAERLIRQGFDGLVARYGDHGRDVARHARSMVRGYYEPTRKEVEALEPLFDRLHREIAGRAAPAADEAAAPSRPEAGSRPTPPPSFPPPGSPPPGSPPPSADTAADGIVVDGRPLSPLQYRYLFPDLSGLPDNERMLLAHYRNHGAPEIAARRRVLPRERLTEIELQRLSPEAPDLAPTDFWRYVPGTGGTLNLICSHFAPPGQFGPTITQNGAPDAQLYIKYEHHEFFQRGVPGIGNAIDPVARWLEAVVARLKPSRLRVVGFSAGGYGALLFGHLLSADAVVAVGAELRLGRPQYRSVTWYPQREYHPAYQDLRPFVPAMKDRVALVYPAYDPIEFRSLQDARAAGVTNIGMTADFHPGYLAVFTPPMLAGPETLVPIRRFVTAPYDPAFDDATVQRLAVAHETAFATDHAGARDMLREVLQDHPRNHGLACHLGVLETLAGDPERGEATILRARQAMVLDYPKGHGERIARGGKPIVRGFYRAAPSLIRRLEGLFDRDPSTGDAEPAAEEKADSV